MLHLSVLLYTYLYLALKTLIHEFLVVPATEPIIFNFFFFVLLLLILFLLIRTFQRLTIFTNFRYFFIFLDYKCIRRPFLGIFSFDFFFIDLLLDIIVACAVTLDITRRKIA